MVSFDALRTVRQILKDHDIKVAHLHNIHHYITPAIIWLFRRAGVKVIWSLHDYKIICPESLFISNGKICEKCVGVAFPFSAIAHRCYRGSLSGSTVVASTIALHRLLRTWHRAVDVIMCPSDIARLKLIETGLPMDKILVKKNALDIDPGLGDGPTGFVVFVGRLSPEKGLSTLIQAWKQNPRLPALKIIGDGPLAECVRMAQAADTRIQWLGSMPIAALLEVVGRANCLVMPSIWYETFGRTTVEAFAKGTPVVGSRIGGTAEIIEEGRTGWLFTPGDASDLAAKVEMVMNLSPEDSGRFRIATRDEYLHHYTSQVNYTRLIEIYHDAIERSRANKQPCK